MERISKKLRCQDGASILLALLFFLLCAMVGASVLMAAASNGGKIDSNRKEQQKYFTLSSALKLVCGELAQAEYAGKYKVETISVPGPNDGDGNPTVAYTYRLISQVKDPNGDFSCGLKDELPLEPELDYLYAALFHKTSGGASQNDDIYVPLASGTSAPADHSLTLTVQMVDGSGLTTPVEVTVRLGKDITDEYRIYLKAVLQDSPDPKYAMYAELLNSSKPSIDALGDGDHVCTSVKWSVSQITKKPSSDSPF